MDTKNLASFCLVFHRGEVESTKILQSIEHLVFIDGAATSPSDLTEESVERARAFLRSQGAPESFLKASDYQVVGTESKIIRIESAKKLVRLFPNSPSFSQSDLDRLLKMDKDAELLSMRICSIIRALLIHCSANLESLSIDGPNTTFPFCVRLEGGSASLLEPFMKKLKVLRFTKFEAFIDDPSGRRSRKYHDPEITSTNVVWLLLNLSNLQEASFYVSLNAQDAAFLKDHSEVSGWMTSNVKRLELDVFKMIESLDQFSAGLERLLYFTKDLYSYTFECFAPETMRSPLINSSLQGLRLSFDTIEELSVSEMFLVHPASRFNSLHLFQNLKVISCSMDSLLSLTLDESIGRSSASLSNPESKEPRSLLPSSVKEFRLIYNKEKPLSAKKSQLLKMSSPESTLAELINSLPKTSSLEIVAVEPLDYIGKAGIFTECSEARKNLEKVFRKAGFRLVVMERDT